MKLIADAGSTKTRWVLMADKPEEACVYLSRGVNPAIMPLSDIECIWREDISPWVAGKKIDEVWYYGAGCIPSVCEPVARLLSYLTECDDCHVSSDMLGSVRALGGRSKALVCILGTGSNSCLCDVGEIIDHIPPLGYILGDEGSGAALGRRFINAVLKREFSAAFRDEFLGWLGMTQQEIIARVYRGEEPNRFLASVTRFIARHIEDDSVAQLVECEFEAFIRNNILRYPDASTVPIYFTGSVAEVFAIQLTAAMHRCGVSVAEIVADPMPRLLAYHSQADY